MNSILNSIYIDEKKSEEDKKSADPSDKVFLNPPAICIESWLHRFKTLDPERDKDFQTAQQPFDEVLGLCAMIPSFIDKGKLDEELENYFKDHPNAKETLRNMLKNYSGGEATSRKKIIEKVQKWMQSKKIDDKKRLDFLIDEIL